MKLIPEWRLVLRHAWSVRLILLAGIFAGFEAVLPFFPEVFGYDQRWIGVLTFAIVMLALVSRFIAQQSIRGKHGED